MSQDQPRVLDINGARYVKVGADYDAQIEKVLSAIGEDMYDALAEAQAMICGGAVLSAFTHQEINDVDVYFRSIESMAQAFKRLTKDWDSVYLGHTDKSITLKDRQTETIVQFIYFDFFDSPDEVFEAFDFTVCMAAIDLAPDGDNFIAHPQFVSDMASRTLKFNEGTRYPYISLLRTKKYQERGYKIGKGNLLSIALACANCPITSWESAEEQLGGVYGNEIKLAVQEDEEFSTERLHELMTALKEHQPPTGFTDYDALCKELFGETEEVK